MPNAIKTLNTTLTKKKSGNEATDLLIANLTSIGEIGVESEEIDVTDHDSVNGYKEYIGGVKDAGEVSISGYIKNETNVETMLALAETQTIEDWEVAYPTGSKWAFKGFIKSFKDGEKTLEGVASFTATIRISGKPTYTKAVAQG